MYGKRFHVMRSPSFTRTFQVIGGAKDCVTLNPKNGERAMVIKNARGDWGIVTAQWQGFRRADPTATFRGQLH